MAIALPRLDAASEGARRSGLEAIWGRMDAVEVMDMRASAYTWLSGGKVGCGLRSGRSGLGIETQMTKDKKAPGQRGVWTMEREEKQARAKEPKSPRLQAVAVGSARDGLAYERACANDAASGPTSVQRLVVEAS